MFSSATPVKLGESSALRKQCNSHAVRRDINFHVTFGINNMLLGQAQRERMIRVLLMGLVAHHEAAPEWCERDGIGTALAAENPRTGGAESVIQPDGGDVIFARCSKLKTLGHRTEARAGNLQRRKCDRGGLGGHISPRAVDKEDGAMTRVQDSFVKTSSRVHTDHGPAIDRGLKKSVEGSVTLATRVKPPGIVILVGRPV